MSQSWTFWILLGYLFGAIPFGWLIARGKGVDLYRVGSGNIGATNVGRVIGKKWGVLCFTLDVLKGLIPVLLAGWFMRCLAVDTLPPGRSWGWLGVAAAAVIGHMFPVWLRFKGGKGVATGLGVLLGVWPVMTLCVFVGGCVWIAVVSVTRYVSLASISAAVSIPIALLLHTLVAGHGIASRTPFLIVALLLGMMVVVRHRSNITRLLAGTEPKLGTPVDQDTLNPVTPHPSHRSN